MAGSLFGKSVQSSRLRLFLFLPLLTVILVGTLVFLWSSDLEWRSPWPANSTKQTTSQNEPIALRKPTPRSPHREQRIQQFVKQCQDAQPKEGKSEDSTKATADAAAAKPLVILFWSTYFGGQGYNGLQPTLSMPGCDLKEDNGEPLGCQFVHDRSQLDKASALVFHSRDVRANDMPPYRLAGQPWILMTQESWVNDEILSHDLWLRNSTLVSLFDMFMTYGLDADIPYPYENEPDSLANALLKPLPDLSTKRSLAKGQTPIAWLGGNCGAQSGRQNYIRKLMEHIPVDSFGACLHTADSAAAAERSTDKTMALLGEYKFYLAMENSNCPGYVTEKYWNALRAGVLPIVDGPPDGYADYEPYPNSLIHAEEFPDPRDLADHLRKLDADDQLYLEHFRHKTTMLNSNFVDLWLRRERLKDKGFCGVCAVGARLRAACAGIPGRQPIKNIFFDRTVWKDHERPGYPCEAPGRFAYLGSPVAV